jgi:hypothetical protein
MLLCFLQEFNSHHGASSRVFRDPRVLAVVCELLITGVVGLMEAELTTYGASLFRAARIVDKSSTVLLRTSSFQSSIRELRLVEPQRRHSKDTLKLSFLILFTFGNRASSPTASFTPPQIWQPSQVCYNVDLRWPELC